MLTAQQVQTVTFSTVRLGLGYNMVEVDDLLDRLGDTLRDYEQGGSGRDVTADELSGATFSETKLREGYKPAEIDEFLQQAIETLQAYEATVASHGPPGAPMAADPAVTDVAHTQRAAAPGAPARPTAPGVHAQAAPPGMVGGINQPAELPSAAPASPEAHAADAARPMRRPSGYSAPGEDGLGVNEVVHRLQSLQAMQDGGMMNAPLQVRTPDGRTFTIAAVKSSPAGLVITLAN